MYIVYNNLIEREKWFQIEKIIKNEDEKNLIKIDVFEPNVAKGCN